MLDLMLQSIELGGFGFEYTFTFEYAHPRIAGNLMASPICAPYSVNLQPLEISRGFRMLYNWSTSLRRLRSISTRSQVDLMVNCRLLLIQIRIHKNKWLGVHSSLEELERFIVVATWYSYVRL
ncbi:hypothetical protein BRADI_2g58195v3 [Brachypodium distachyon]|uniref:Uncharacterized protein n=1 Tax=Brachypodium distachyon TaxID=15368 RepID=A0A2K2DGM1_BRADI|nr:hypothetical protein BRADI_2g58195v3 [Brachypodium distachyon]